MAIYRATYTHKGWIGLCPVHIGRYSDEDPDIKAAHPILDLWLDLQFAIYDLLNSMMVEEVGWPIRITGRLNPPITLEHEVDE